MVGGLSQGGISRVRANHLLTAILTAEVSSGPNREIRAGSVAVCSRLVFGMQSPVLFRQSFINHTYPIFRISFKFKYLTPVARVQPPPFHTPTPVRPGNPPDSARQGTEPPDEFSWLEFTQRAFDPGPEQFDENRTGDN
jgi:hypothetical protein